MNEVWQDMKKVITKHWLLLMPSLTDAILGIMAKALVLACCIKYLWFSGGGAVG